ncbi:MAG: DUF2249 domain-containing protein [Intrasporangium sp.]|uniref:DUF2249 domain-containing protein n=1 Tax=Intrasporangium sp. TaxID=1925024 RepID=UPI002649D02E|nr:DUF2249 domain-containing protein [Intrasporangium sp.]MDN5794759.1 DUF2249 domain-containing protein [Intrasporangium sp.]
MSTPVVDTREGGRASCADLTNAAFDGLTEGSQFILVADHDPTPLKYMLNAERPGQVSWAPIEQGPELWRVEVGRTQSPTARIALPDGIGKTAATSNGG